MANISIFGLGYVGIVSAACYANEGHNVIGVEVNKAKVDIINRGCSPVIEKDLETLIGKSINNRTLEATVDGKYAVFNSDVSFVCVGTPSNINGSLNLDYIKRVIHEIAGYLKEKDAYHIVVIRSTVLPGTIEDILVPILENVSEKKVGKDFGITMNPEFMREGSAVNDFYNPPKIIIGASNDFDAQSVAVIYRNIKATTFKTTLKIAEMVKYTDNIFHALKVTFANEVGKICKGLNLDAHEVMTIFCKDTKLNISEYYFNPGFAFGGSCLPKDMRALSYQAKSLDIDIPLLDSILQSNNLQIKNAAQRVMALGKRKIGVLGFAFKALTDDLRESPLVELIEILLGKGYNIKIYDREVYLTKLIGTNKEYIEKRIPHIPQLMVKNINEIITESEVIIIGNKNQEFRHIFPLLKKDQHVLDLVRIADNIESDAQYEGLYW